MKKTASKTKPQTTIVSVAVTTAGPVPMVAVREVVQSIFDDRKYMAQYIRRARSQHTSYDKEPVISITVKRDANIERPRR